MGKIAKILEKSGYSLDDLGHFDEPEVVFDLVEDETGVSSGEWSRASSVCRSKTGPSLGVGGSGAPLKGHVPCAGEFSASFRELCSKLFHRSGARFPRSIMVSSVMPQEGRSLVSLHLAGNLAQMEDRHSLLVDCDLHLPSLAGLLDIPNESGIADYLRDDKNLASLIRETSVDKMSFLASGLPPEDPSEHLASVRMHDLVDALASSNPERCIIFDTPPLQLAPESIIFSYAVDGVILVVRPGYSSRAMLDRSIADIGVNKILGVLYNDCRKSTLEFNEMS